MTNSANLLNIGCGLVAHPAWVNLDCVAYLSTVQVHDIRKGLPFPDSSFQVCYSSHVLEHLTRTEAKSLLDECFRVLSSQGIIRVVVPDLEGIARSYLHTLEQVDSGNNVAILDYDWMLLELLDQMVRTSSGGEMGIYFRQPELKNKDFIESRIGSELKSYLAQQNNLKKLTIWEKLKSKSISQLVETLRISLAKYSVTVLSGKRARQAFEEGLFRNSGEIHRYMYDRFSLGRLLEQVGFVNVRVCQADESRIPGFNHYQLDVVEGRVRRPDSLFMEAMKP